MSALGHVGLEKLGCDQRVVKHFAQEREKLAGIFAEEIIGEVALTGVGHTFHKDAAEIEELCNGLGIVECGGLTKEFVGGMGLRPELLVGTARLDGEVEFDQVEVVVGEKIKDVAIGQTVLLRNQRGDRWRGEHFF